MATRTAKRQFVNGTVIQVTAIQEDKTHRTWAWIVAPKLREPIEGKLKAARHKPASMILLKVAEIMSNPSSPHLPPEWAETMDRRFLWHQVFSEIRLINKELEGISRTAH